LQFAAHSRGALGGDEPLQSRGLLRAGNILKLRRTRGEIKLSLSPFIATHNGHLDQDRARRKIALPACVRVVGSASNGDKDACNYFYIICMVPVFRPTTICGAACCNNKTLKKV
jgi:hypothetical protein